MVQTGSSSSKPVEGSIGDRCVDLWKVAEWSKASVLKAGVCVTPRVRILPFPAGYRYSSTARAPVCGTGDTGSTPVTARPQVV